MQAGAAVFWEFVGLQPLLASLIKLLDAILLHGVHERDETGRDHRLLHDRNKIFAEEYLGQRRECRFARVLDDIVRESLRHNACDFQDLFDCRSGDLGGDHRNPSFDHIQQRLWRDLLVGFPHLHYFEVVTITWQRRIENSLSSKHFVTAIILSLASTSAFVRICLLAVNACCYVGNVPPANAVVEDVLDVEAWLF